MKILSLFLLIFMIVSAVQADFNCQQNIKPLGQELSQLQASYNDLSTYQADFQQKSFLATLQVEDVSEGQLWVSKPGKTRWSYQSPEKMEYLIKDNSFWHYQSVTQQLQITDLADSNLSTLPTDLLTGQVDFAKSFRLSLFCKNSANDLVYTLVPKTDQFSVENVKLVARDSKIIAIEFIDQSGNVNSIQLSNVLWNPVLADQVFTIDYPDETFLNDQRKL